MPKMKNKPVRTCKTKKTARISEKTPPKNKRQVFVNQIIKKLENGKAENIKVFDVRGYSSITDTIIIATGTSGRHVLSLAYHLAEELKSRGMSVFCDGNKSQGDWVVLDTGCEMIHIFTLSARLEYCLDEMWQENEA